MIDRVKNESKSYLFRIAFETTAGLVQQRFGKSGEICSKFTLFFARNFILAEKARLRSSPLLQAETR
jgi:hypothetical protein